MRIGIVSDTHIQDGRPALPAALVEALRGTDLILHAGDIADESGLAAFKAIGPEVVAVIGNVDRGRLLQILPEQAIVPTEFGDIALVHVLPMSTHQPRLVLDRMLAGRPRPLAVVYGHTHRAEVSQFRLDDGQRAFVINPGSPFRSRGTGHTFALMELSDQGRSVWIEHLK